MAHLKRITTPRSWSLPRKTEPWATRPQAGPHSLEGSLPIAVVLRDYLHVSDNNREARWIIGQGQVLRDGKKVNSPKLGVGLMDVISLPLIKAHYRVLPDHRARLQLEPIPAKNSKWKLCRIEDKSIVRGGKVQLNLHDGRNLLVDKDKYQTGDVLKLKVPDQSITAHYPLAEGNQALIIGGRHAGQVSQVTGYTVYRGMNPTSVAFADDFTTTKEYTFIIGKDKPEITLPQEVAL